MPKIKTAKTKKLVTQQSVDKIVWGICNIMRRGNCASALQYVPELTWILFLRILDEREQREEQEAEALGVPFKPSLEAPYRWQDWATSKAPLRETLTNGAPGDYFGFVNGKLNEHGEREGLLPYLKSLKDKANAAPRQKVISEIMTGVERVRIDTERNFLDVIDDVQGISAETVDPRHVFTLSQVYEGLLLKMGEKSNDGGQFFTPREVIRAMVRVLNPTIGETVYDPCCGTGGFLAQSYEYMRQRLGDEVSSQQLELLKQNTFWGREKENLVYPIALANLVLHGLDKPNLWHGNTLTDNAVYGGLFEGAPMQFDVILTNPPFGGKEGEEAQTNFDYKTNATQVLFLQHVIRSLKEGGRCGIVLDEGLLFRTDSEAFVKTKRKLLDDCDVWCIVSLPAGVFGAAGAAVKTDLIFFTKGKPTQTIWYYDLSEVRVRKKMPLTIQQFDSFFDLLPSRADSELSWTINFAARRAAALAEAKPFRAQAMQQNEAAQTVKAELAELKKIKPRDDLAISTMQEKLNVLIKEARELNSKAQEIEDAAYDLKAVNPNQRATVDERTPDQLLEIIAARNQDIAEALAMLRQQSV